MKLKDYTKEVALKELKDFKEKRSLTVERLAEMLLYSKESIYKKLAGDVAVSKRDIQLIRSLKSTRKTDRKESLNGKGK